MGYRRLYIGGTPRLPFPFTDTEDGDEDDVATETEILPNSLLVFTLLSPPGKAGERVGCGN